MHFVLFDETTNGAIKHVTIRIDTMGYIATSYSKHSAMAVIRMNSGHIKKHDFKISTYSYFLISIQFSKFYLFNERYENRVCQLLTSLKHEALGIVTSNSSCMRKSTQS